MNREERDALRRAIDRERRARIDWSTQGAELDKEPRHESCTLHKEVVLHRPAWNGCAYDESYVEAGAVLLGARLAAVQLGTGAGAPPPSVLFGRAA